MPFFNCKFELKLKWTKYCVLAAAGIGNTNDNPNKNICTIKDTKICSCRHFISKKKKNQKLSKLFSKGFERSVYWNEYKTNKRE